MRASDEEIKGACQNLSYIYMRLCLVQDKRSVAEGHSDVIIIRAR